MLILGSSLGGLVHYQPQNAMIKAVNCNVLALFPNYYTRPILLHSIVHNIHTS